MEAVDGERDRAACRGGVQTQSRMEFLTATAVRGSTDQAERRSSMGVRGQDTREKMADLSADDRGNTPEA
jgi:hypothetical protein